MRDGNYSVDCVGRNVRHRPPCRRGAGMSFMSFKYKNHEWSTEEVGRFCFDGSSDGVCMACDEESSGHEPDAQDNWCPCCEELAVKSVPVLLHLI